MASPFRRGGWAAAASGIMGIVTFSTLVIGVNVRDAQGLDGTAFILFRIHDGTAVLQFLFLLQVLFSLYRLSQQGANAISRMMLNMGIAALLLTMLLLLLNFSKIVGEPMYMFSQGTFGVWIIIACLSMKTTLPRVLRGFGIVAGTGMVLVGLFPLGYAIFVDTVILQIPAAPDEVIEKIPVTAANTVLHYILYTGTFMGIIPFPFWTILIGRRLLREEKNLALK